MRMRIKRAEAKLAVMAMSMLVATPAFAAGGLSKATSVLTTITADVKTIIPVVAILALTGLGLAWGLKWIRFLTLIQLGGGVILAGCASELVAMLF